MTKVKKPAIKKKKAVKVKESDKLPDINTSQEYWASIFGNKSELKVPFATLNGAQSVICAIIKCKCGSVYNYRSRPSMITKCDYCGTCYQVPLILSPVELSERQISYIERKCGGI